MTGLVGAVTQRDVTPMLVEGLRRHEAIAVPDGRYADPIPQHLTCA